jgi:hypothetical protein
VAARCHEIDPATVPKEFQSRNAKITDSVRANQSKVKSILIILHIKISQKAVA